MSICLCFQAGKLSLKDRKITHPQALFYVICFYDGNDRKREKTARQTKLCAVNDPYLRSHPRPTTQDQHLDQLPDRVPEPKPETLRNTTTTDCFEYSFEKGI